MELSEIKIGVRVVYARGAKEPLIGELGTIVTEYDPNEFGIIMIDFDNYGHSPCFYKNLDRI
jgi:hypothetical protein